MHGEGVAPSPQVPHGMGDTVWNMNLVVCPRKWLTSRDNLVRLMCHREAMQIVGMVGCFGTEDPIDWFRIQESEIPFIHVVSGLDTAKVFPTMFLMSRVTKHDI
jgi:hypothetical protein